MLAFDRGRVKCAQRQCAQRPYGHRTASGQPPPGLRRGAVLKGRSRFGAYDFGRLIGGTRPFDR
jgi:hypothetical protein